jgi:hypothetical protein
MDLLVTLLVGIAIIWLVQTLLGAFELKEPASKIIFVVTIILVIIWILSGKTFLLR